MKRLYLLRHAKSSWDSEALSDFDRPLNDRGRRAAPLMARWLARQTARPEVIVSSPACRAWSTACCFADALRIPYSDMIRVPAIYDASLSALCRVVERLPGGAGTLLMAGHNPGFTQLAEWLAGTPLHHMPTCALYGFELPVDDWMEVTAGLCAPFVFMTPRHLELEDA